jgi:periplasmic protein TonB
MLELSQTRTVSGPQVRFATHQTQSQQPKKLMAALVLLLIALVAVLVQDRQFWFGTEQATIVSDVPETQAPAPVAAVPTPAQPQTNVKKQVPAVKAQAKSTSTAEPLVATTRTPLPPLDVEVIGGNAHRTVHPVNPASKIDIAKPVTSAVVPTETLAAPTKAADLAPAPALPMIQQPSTSINTAYPVLAPHMFVQGSVVLQAIIGTDGQVENLTMISGPAILASAAQQAVRGWHFRPIFVHGQAVESKAMITVNFTINVADRSKNS